jgi:Translationally controlled tumour protein
MFNCDLLYKGLARLTLIFKPWLLSLINDKIMTCLVIQINNFSRKEVTSIFSLCNFRVLAKLEEKTPDQVDIFKTNINTVMKDILGRFKDLQFFTGESMDADGMIAMLEYRDIDGVSTPILMCFKHGLDEEKF